MSSIAETATTHAANKGAFPFPLEKIMSSAVSTPPTAESLRKSLWRRDARLEITWKNGEVSVIPFFDHQDD